jgi:hypothetical protein
MIWQRLLGLVRQRPATPSRQTHWWIGLITLVAAVGVAAGPRITAASAQGAPGQAPAAAGSTQTSEGNQVTVKVTWAGPTSGLVFRVALDTHSVDLDQYDLRVLAVLRVGPGTDVRPSAWDAPKGGHHREGTLTFPAQGPDGKNLLGQDVREITLMIRDVAGVPERTFRWTW